jgi:hypothetical protein
MKFGSNTHGEFSTSSKYVKRSGTSRLISDPRSTAPLISIFNQSQRAIASDKTTGE